MHVIKVIIESILLHRRGYQVSGSVVLSALCRSVIALEYHTCSGARCSGGEGGRGVVAPWAEALDRSAAEVRRGFWFCMIS